MNGKGREWMRKKRFVFLEIDEPDKPSWDVMDYLLKVLNKGKNMELLWKGETPEEQEKIRGHVLNMISATYLKPRPEDEK